MRSAHIFALLRPAHVRVLPHLTQVSCCFLALFLVSGLPNRVKAQPRSQAKAATQFHAIDSMHFIPAGFRIPPHPRILLPAGEEDLLKKHIASHPAWKAIGALIIHQADSLINLPPNTRILIGIRLLATSRDCLFRIFHLSFAWRMTGEKKYFDRAEKELLAVAAFTDWNPSHYLDVAEMTTGVAIGYDWLYPKLSPQSRAVIREAILKKGIATSYDTAYHAYRKWLSVTNNWNQVCNTGMLLGALAVYEDNPALARKVIDRSIASIAIAMKDYDPDGAFAEGYTYWGYGTTFNVLFLSVLQKIFKTDFGLSSTATGAASFANSSLGTHDRQPGWQKTAAYLENMVGPTGKAFNYSDATETSILQPAMFWFANQQQDPSLLWNQREFLSDRDHIAKLSDRLLPALLIWSEGIDLSKIPPPKNLFWVGAGRNPIALMRSSWTDTAAIFIGLKGGSPSVTHGHMDIGSFVMDAQGTRWAMDPGMQDYNLLEQRKIDLWANQQDGQRWTIFRYHNRAHNTLLVNGHSQRVDGFAAVKPGPPKSLQAVADLTSLYEPDLKTTRRTISIVEKKYVLVQDEISTGKEGALVRWSMLTPATITVTSRHTALLRIGNKSLSFSVEVSADASGTPAGVTAVESPVVRTFIANPPPADYDEPNPGVNILGFELSLPPGAHDTFRIFLIPGDKPVVK